MIVINIALIILGILYGVGSVTNFKEWYYRHDYLAIALSVFTSILLVVAGVLNTLNWGSINLAKSYVEEWTWRKIIKLYNGVFTTNKDLIALEVTSIVNNNWCADWRYLNVIELTAKHRVQGDGNALVNQQPFAYCEHSIMVMLQIPNL